MSQFDDSCQLEISRVYPEDQGEYTCVATNGGGTASCSATLTLDGEFDPVWLSAPLTVRWITYVSPRLHFLCHTGEKVLLYFFFSETPTLIPVSAGSLVHC